jgi:hypothetical protein
MFVQQQDTPRAAVRGLTGNHSRAVARGLTGNHSRVVVIPATVRAAGTGQA